MLTDILPVGLIDEYDLRVQTKSDAGLRHVPAGTCTWFLQLDRYKYVAAVLVLLVQNSSIQMTDNW